MRITALIALLAFLLAACERRDTQTKMDIPAADQSDERGLFLSWRHPVSHRTAILEEMDGMVWLYLSQPETTQPARDCPAFITATPAESVDWERIQQTGEPPAITKDVASDQALIEHPSPEDFSTIWSSDGESVALQHRGEFLCMIVAEQQRGHSKALQQSSPLGEPFDEKLATSTFTATQQP